jgi:hypothetical protein
MLTGSCQCGALAFECEGPDFLTFCHGHLCQQRHGSAFAILHAETKTFRWLKGEEALIYYHSWPDVRRAFCVVCGSGLDSVTPWVPPEVSRPQQQSVCLDRLQDSD